MTASAVPRLMFTWVPSGKVKQTPYNISDVSLWLRVKSAVIGRNIESDGGICLSADFLLSRRRVLAFLTLRPLFCIHLAILRLFTCCSHWNARKHAVGSWFSACRNMFHTLLYRSAANIFWGFNNVAAKVTSIMIKKKAASRTRLRLIINRRYAAPLSATYLP